MIQILFLYNHDMYFFISIYINQTNRLPIIRENYQVESNNYRITLYLWQNYSNINIFLFHSTVIQYLNLYYNIHLSCTIFTRNTAPGVGGGCGKLHIRYTDNCLAYHSLALRCGPQVSLSLSFHLWSFSF